jgi:hypothetical protein
VVGAWVGGASVGAGGGWEVVPPPAGCVLWVLALDGTDVPADVPAEGVGCVEGEPAADGDPLAGVVGEDAAFPAVVCVEDVVVAP